ncbi:uncharacterized protein RHOBADRAFT_51020 [Rhodotorula graminis WP1]|uniref:Abscisic acid G-protein coupled receptor-like domain-containing protein n=1 Tax=Rhodotorula graminis (strain WP1) TaxID=578459 RepID=A0A194SCV6_RHOGW|nr:uncharacterized protein RHOBADRAFT_51020 [Rhodotorula graminis WP1]KPV78568.1 hypothetical protein RHOBADRAFT_51020 [Rhodotorula graminis WP1]
MDAAGGTAPLPPPPTSSPVLVETALLSLVRLALFIACRHYVNFSLFSDLRSVIREDGLATDLDSPDGGALELEDAEDGYFGLGAGGGAGAGAGKAMAAAARESLHAPGGGGAGAGGRGASWGGDGRRGSLTPGGGGTAVAGRAYTRLSTALFCLSFSESGMLFTLLLFGDVVSARARDFNWSLSLLALLSLIVFVIPFGLCLLLTHRSRSNFARTFLLTFVPFALYLFVFYRVGSLVAEKHVVEGSHSFGLVNELLSRICVPGVILIASLSGGGAVNTAWEAYEWRSVSSSEPVTDSSIAQAERALARTRLDLQQRNRSLALARGSAAREAESAAGQSLLSRWTTTSPAATHLKSLELEVSAMQKMERQMTQDVHRLKVRQAMRDRGRSWRGRLWLAVGWLFSLYCVWRVFTSCINLIFGYTRKSHQHAAIPVEGGGQGELPPTPVEGTDLFTSLLTRVAVGLDVELDVATWSRMLGFVLIGGILLANMRNVLSSVSRIFKATSMGMSASFMLLFLAQLMAVYLLTSLISLPSSPTASSTQLLDTLPDFQVFSRLFDSVFLLAAVALFVSRWIGRKFADEAGLASQYA